MMTVHEVSALTGVSIRTLHYYDHIGLLPPAQVTAAGYRLYDDAALERLQHILLFRELEFPLHEIREILDSPDFDRSRALEQQVKLLQLKKERLEALIALAHGIQTIGVGKMDFTAFDTRKRDAYAQEAKQSWGKTAEYREYQQKSAGRSPQEEQRLGVELLGILAGFGQMLGDDPTGEAARAQVKKLQAHISQHYYACSDAILLSLGHMYADDGRFTKNIDKAGGEGTAAFACRAIDAYCNR